MITANMRVIVLALAGMVVGYAAWLAGGVAIILTTPVHYWGAGAAGLLVAIALFAFAGARRYQNSNMGTAAVWMPTLPILASGYLLLGFLH